MRSSHVRAVFLFALAAPLGACSSFLGIHLGHHLAKSSPRANPVPAPQLASPSAATDAGRKQLNDGQTGLAIESFRRALGNGEPVGPALNGMGVAYARLGRYDLAHRFFEEAVASDPADSRYSENLARLMRSPVLAMRRDGDVAAAAMKAAAALPAEPLAAAAPGSLQRISRGEVRIVTAPPQAAPLRGRNVELDRRFKPLVRVAIGGGAAQPQSFVRIVLPETKPASPEMQATRAAMQSNSK